MQACGERLRAYRQNRKPGQAGRGTKVVDRHRRSAENRRLVAERRERRRERLAHKAQSERLASGLPLWTEAELDRLVDETSSTD